MKVREHRLYRIWAGMRYRCASPYSVQYADYGGRGIYVCADWRDDFLTFFLWACLNGYTPALTLDRIDNDGPYSPENCRWATYIEQNNNKRRTKYHEAFGETKTLKEWSRDDRCVPSYRVLHQRVSEGSWTIEAALLAPSRTYKGANEIA